jgi:hypothetical protein
MIALDVATTFIKAGAAITADDISVGDQVSVIVVRTENGIMQAVTVEVLA